MPIFQQISEGFARKTSRRGLFGRGADVLFGTLAGALQQVNRGMTTSFRPVSVISTSGDTMAASRRWSRVDPDSIGLRSPRSRCFRLAAGSP
jgi:hypothetical protein